MPRPKGSKNATTLTPAQEQAVAARPKGSPYREPPDDRFQLAPLGSLKVGRFYIAPGERAYYCGSCYPSDRGSEQLVWIKKASVVCRTCHDVNASACPQCKGTGERSHKTVTPHQLEEQHA